VLSSHCDQFFQNVHGDHPTIDITRADFLGGSDFILNQKERTDLGVVLYKNCRIDFREESVLFATSKAVKIDTSMEMGIV
jgi:hypothetical protein